MQVVMQHLLPLPDSFTLWGGSNFLPTMDSVASCCTILSVCKLPRRAMEKPDLGKDSSKCLGLILCRAAWSGPKCFIYQAPTGLATKTHADSPVLKITPSLSCPVFSMRMDAVELYRQQVADIPFCTLLQEAGQGESFV